MNKTEREVVTAALENIYAGTERRESESLDLFNKRMETSAKDGCHTIMKLVESTAGNKEVIKNTILFLEKKGFLDEDYMISDILGSMTTHKFTGD